MALDIVGSRKYGILQLENNGSQFQENRPGLTGRGLILGLSRI
ncbi:MAG: hypothetical protein ACOZF2_10275 [Thermodesulfobacteriota bacterium]